MNPSNYSSLSEVAFQRMISTELRRVERSHKFLVMMMLDIGELPISGDNALTLKKFNSALRLNLRETDVVGWYKEGRVVGVIFTEVASDMRTAIPDILMTRVREILQSIPHSQDFHHIRLSFHVGLGDERDDVPS